MSATDILQGAPARGAEPREGQGEEGGRENKVLELYEVLAKCSSLVRAADSSAAGTVENSPRMAKLFNFNFSTWKMFWTRARVSSWVRPRPNLDRKRNTSNFTTASANLEDRGGMFWSVLKISDFHLRFSDVTISLKIASATEYVYFLKFDNSLGEDNHFFLRSIKIWRCQAELLEPEHLRLG